VVRQEGSGRLPDFVIVGAMRSGTTSLAHYLRAHPDVFIPADKELHFFDRHFDRGVEWYRSQFAQAGSRAAAGEATPAYMYLPEAIDRLRRVVPRALLVAILRDPVERAYSHYLHRRERGIETLPFLDALLAEPERLATGDRDAVLNHSYVDRGRYLRQLTQICEFYPRSAVHVLLFEDLVASPREAYGELCRFISIDDGFVPSDLGRVINASVSFRSLRVRRLVKRSDRLGAKVLARLNTRPMPAPPMDQASKRFLTDAFADENVRLAEWLGRDLPRWTR
jgi:hypothetical protein